MAPCRGQVDGVVLHVDPGEVAASIAEELADGQVAETDGVATQTPPPAILALTISILLMLMGSLQPGGVAAGLGVAGGVEDPGWIDVEHHRRGDVGGCRFYLVAASGQVLVHPDVDTVADGQGTGADEGLLA